jgi:hypothetical protein
MATSIELVLLKCIQCGTPVPANEDEAAWTCAQCGQGMQLTEAGLAPLAVNWAAARPGATQLRWLPFWVFTGAVTFLRRETYGGSLFGGGQPDKLWDSPRRFYVPAYPAALQEIETLGADLTRRQPRLAPGPAAGALSQCTLFPDDARRAAEFVVLTIEADRKDKLRQVDFTLSLQDPMLWVLPFAGEKPALAE